MKPTWQAYLELSLAMAIVGSSVVAGKLLVVRFPVFLGAGLRFLVAAVMLLPVLLREQRTLYTIRRTDWLWIFLQALSGVFLFSVLLLYGLRWSSASESGIITSSTPAVLGLISFVLLKDRPTWNKVAGIACTLLGVLSINLPAILSGGGQSSLWGNLLVLGAVINEALFTIFRKLVAERVSPLVSTALMSWLGLLLFLPFALYEARNFNPGQVTLADGALVLYYGVVVTIVAFLLWFRGISSVPASTAAVFTGVWPVSAVLLSYLVLGERFAPTHLLGILCVLTGIGLIAWERTPRVSLDEEAA